jgi:hypothetical protein
MVSERLTSVQEVFRLVGKLLVVEGAPFASGLHKELPRSTDS